MHVSQSTVSQSDHSIHKTPAWDTFSHLDQSISAVGKQDAFNSNESLLCGETVHMVHLQQLAGLIQSHKQVKLHLLFFNFAKNRITNHTPKPALLLHRDTTIRQSAPDKAVQNCDVDDDECATARENSFGWFRAWLQPVSARSVNRHSAASAFARLLAWLGSGKSTFSRKCSARLRQRDRGGLEIATT